MADKQQIATVTQGLNSLQETHNSDISSVTDRLDLLENNFNKLLGRLSNFTNVEDLVIG